jgi:hypothetical protein
LGRRSSLSIPLVVLLIAGCKETVENQAPNASASGPETADAGDWVQLDGSDSSDPDGDALNMRWSFVQLPMGSAAVLNDPTVENPSFLADMPGEYEVRLVVDDGFLRSDPASVTITADPVNGRPTADAGLDRGVVTGNDVLLDGTGSSDPEDDTLTYAWSFVARPSGSNAAFDDDTSATPTFTADLDGDYRIHLIVSDGELESPPDEVVINAAADNLAPVADAGVDQSVAVGTSVDLDGSGSYDPNGSALTYTWTFTERPLGSTSSITQDGTAAATFLADVEGTFVVALVVDDGTVSSAPDSLQVQAFIENNPPVANAGDDILNAKRGVAVYLDGSQSSDADIDDLLSFTWTFVERPSGSQATLNDPHVVRPTFVPDVVNEPSDPDDVYKLRLQVWDGVFWSAPDEVAVRAGDGNLPPVADAGDDATDTVGETVWLDGSESHDGEGVHVLDAYKWAFTQTPNGFFGGLNDDTIVNPSFLPTVDGLYKIQLEVWDGEFWSPADEVEIDVGEGNQVPVAVIKGADPTVCDADTTQQDGDTCDVDERAPVITLDGSDSDDETPELLLFEWAFTSKPPGSNATFNDPTLENPSFVPDLLDDYIVRLRVWDGEFWSESVAVTITVTTYPNRRPTAAASFVPANPTPDTVCSDATSDVVVGQVVQLSSNGTVDVDTDPVDPLTYEWTVQELPTGSLATLNDATVEDPSILPDVNTGALEAYSVRLRVYDGALWSAPATVDFTAGCGNTAPEADAGDDRIDETGLPQPGPDNSVTLGIVQLDGCDSSDPDGDDLFYEWQFYTLPEASDAVLNNTGVCNPSFDADELGFYSLRLQVNDGDLASGWDYVTIEAK